MNLQDKLDELQSDFSDVFDKLDFKNYNPLSDETKMLVNIGLVWFLAEKLKHSEDKALKHSKDHIQDELMSAEEYYDKWLTTRDSTLKQMVKDELKHADYFIKQSRMMVKDITEQAKLQRYISWYNNLLSKISE